MSVGSQRLRIIIFLDENRWPYISNGLITKNVFVTWKCTRTLSASTSFSVLAHQETLFTKLPDERWNRERSAKSELHSLRVVLKSPVTSSKGWREGPSSSLWWRHGRCWSWLKACVKIFWSCRKLFSRALMSLPNCKYFTSVSGKPLAQDLTLGNIIGSLKSKSVR